MRPLRAAILVAAVLCVPVLGLASSTALAQDVGPPADPAPTTTGTPKPDPAPPPAPPKRKAKPQPPPPPPPAPPPPSSPPAAVVVPPPAPPPPPAAAKPKQKTERGKAGERRTTKRKNARQKLQLPVQPTIDDEAELTPVEPLANPQPAPSVAKKGGDLMTSPLIRVLLMAAAALALLTMLVAALPLAALERITETHWRTEQVATFVDGHRLDLVVGGVATLLVALVVALPTVAG